MKREQQQRGPQTITVETLINVLRQLEPKSRLGILLGGLVATADELGFQEAELVRVVRVACVQRAIAMQVQKDRALVNAAGHPVMPTGPIDLARPIPWRCPLCDREVPASVKHKHTAQDWMTGKRVLSDPDEIEQTFNGTPRPMTAFEDFQEPGPLAPDCDWQGEEPPTLDESVKGRERVEERPAIAGCRECGEGWPEHRPGCSRPFRSDG